MLACEEGNMSRRAVIPVAIILNLVGFSDSWADTCRTILPGPAAPIREEPKLNSASFARLADVGQVVVELDFIKNPHGEWVKIGPLKAVSPREYWGWVENKFLGPRYKCRFG
jgi:hypothetical protein